MTLGPVDLYHLALVVLVALVPVLVVPYTWVAAEALMAASGYRYRRAHDPAFYASFVVLVAVGVVLAPAPVDLSPSADAVVLASGPLGAGLYRVDRRVWNWWTDRQVWVSANSPSDVVATVVGPPAEEVVYRGGLSVVVPWVGPAGYVGLSAVLFGVNHYALGRNEMVIKTWNGVVYAVLFLVAGSVLAPVLAHGAYNLVYLLVVRSRTGEWWVRVRERDEASS